MTLPGIPARHLPVSGRRASSSYSQVSLSAQWFIKSLKTKKPVPRMAQQKGNNKMTKIYVRMTKKFLTGNLKGIVISNVLEAANEDCAKRDVARLPKGSTFQTIEGSQVEVLAHDYVIE